jgi:hypothetical protein
VRLDSCNGSWEDERYKNRRLVPPWDYLLA